MAEYSSYGRVEDTLPHLARVVLDNGEFISAQEVREYILQLRQEHEAQAHLLQQFADVGCSFEHADDLARGFGRPQYD